MSNIASVLRTPNEHGQQFTALDAYRPIPPAAQGSLYLPDRLAKGYHVQELNDGVYWVSQGWYDAGFIVTGSGVVVLDAPPNLGELMLSAIEEVTDEPVTHVVYSHWHADHIGAASIFGNNVVRIAHDLTRQELERFPDPQRPLPTETFTDHAVLDVGGVRLELSYKGMNHASGNIFTYAPAQRVLMAVDIICPGWVPFRNLFMAENIHGFLQAHDQILDYDFDHLITGHLTRTGTKEDVETQREYMFTLRDIAAQALVEVDLAHIIDSVGISHSWVLFDSYINELVRLTTDRLLNTKTATGQTWTERLAGADLWSHQHAFSMIQGHRLESSQPIVRRTPLSE
ncbi:MBL fold metallo-hydrolase [Dictyobacter alpinus]|uniref:MBL fold metallo-hydrolase n=1 Tax=Dictyobacter alpinus TaxID=2014873 RepID=A0A402BCU5_9CHLR|nr:MBL fold metallo-hydrolase [Dictyobacter alpinus]GCE29154.1 MBL fold metallo-hydrolase [Dictyobacter alpinus]